MTSAVSVFLFFAVGMVLAWCFLRFVFWYLEG